MLQALLDPEGSRWWKSFLNLCGKKSCPIKVCRTELWFFSHATEEGVRPHVLRRGSVHRKNQQEAGRRKWREREAEGGGALTSWGGEVRGWGCRGKEKIEESKKKKKKEGWITFPYCMCSRIRHLGVPDVRHSHQTFQIKAPPHPSSPPPPL